ncbi:MAG: beta-galactosidase [Anaerolineae bacterium]|nr:beta-galactosidase [Anaerolineae bacterium]
METTGSPTPRNLGRLLTTRAGTHLLTAFIVVLIAAVLVLPPVSLRERILDRGHQVISLEGGAILDPDGTQVTFPAAAMTGAAKIKLTSIPRTIFLEGSAGKALVAAAQAIPNSLVPRGPLYTLNLRGRDKPSAATLTVPIPNDSEPYETLDLYTWDGTAWRWLPSQVIYEDETIEARLNTVPANFIVMQTNPRTPSAAGSLAVGAEIPAEGNEALAEVRAAGLYLGGDGALEGNPADLPKVEPGSGYAVIPWVRNWGEDGVVRTDLINNLLVSREWQDRHIAALTEMAVANLYPIVSIDYRGVEPQLRGEFSAFIARLAETLHSQNKVLSVRVEEARQVSEDRWLTGGYDWQAIGQAADEVEIPALVDPRAYTPGGQMEQFLRWTASQVSRYKVRLVLPARSVEQAGPYLLLKSYNEALAPLVGPLRADKGVVPPGGTINLTLVPEHSATLPEADPATGMIRYQYKDNAGEVRTVWLENAASLSRKLGLASRYHLGGITIGNLFGESQDTDPEMWAAVRQFQQSGTVPPVDSQFTLAWRTVGVSAKAAPEQRPLNDVQYSWQAPAEPGEYQAEVSLLDRGKPVGTPQVVSLLVASPTPTPTPTNTPTNTPLPTATPTNTPTSTPLPPTATPRPTNTRAPQTQSSSPPPGGFGYGIQAHMVDNGHAPKVVEMTKGMGFGWIKQQVEWFRHEPSKGQYAWGSLDEIANVASANGIKVLFSVVKAPRWARPGNTDFNVEGPPANPQDFADFLAAIAARYRGKVQAYEVWNEQNLHYEWGNEPLDAGRYVQLLAASYRAIKSVCPECTVISGALTPAGDNPGKAIDDFTYLEQMYKAGLRNYADAIGAHPSGYNLSPDVTWQQGCAFITQDNATFRGACDSPHHSWSFRGTMEGYRNIMVVYGDGGKRIWPTEFGWASSSTPAPGYGYAADNSLDEQARWTVRAYQMMKSWGWVGAAFLWNLNFKVVAPGRETAQWGIVDEGWGPLPAYNALRDMPK